MSRNQSIRLLEVAPLFSKDLAMFREFESDAQDLLKHLDIVEQCVRQMEDEIKRLEAENAALKAERDRLIGVEG